MSTGRRTLTVTAAATIAAAALALAGTAVTTASADSGGNAPTTTRTTTVPAAENAAGQGGRVIRASVVAKVAELDPPSSFGQVTVLEGPAFGPDGQLYLVHLSAAPGTPKILRFDPRTKVTTPVYSDTTSAFSSLQFNPVDHRIYLTDFSNGTINRLEADGHTLTTVFSGPVDGQTMVPDDMTFDRNGAMYVTDYHGTPWDRTGRVVRLDPDGTHPVVVQGGLSGPNGISFSADYSALWVGEYSLGHEDHLTLAKDGKSVVDGGVGMTANIGAHGFDSNAVDAAGNVYQVVIGTDHVLVWNPSGDLVATIVVPSLARSNQLVSNLAIRPGTTDGYLTVGGDTGGFVYRFKALAPGIAQSNGG